MKSKKSKFSTISLPTQLIGKIKEKIKGTGMHSPSAYVTFILRQLVSEQSKKENNKGFSKEEERAIRARLKSLGYLD